MQIKKTSILAAILSLCMILGIMPGAMAFDQTNITSRASISADFPIYDGHSVSMVNDGMPTTGLACDPNADWELPVHLNISFGELNAEISEVKLGSMLGANMGITKFDFEYKDGEEWKVALAGAEIPWQYTDTTYEEMTYHLSKRAISNEFRLTITETVRRHFRLDEINLYGQMKGLANPVEVTGVKPVYVKTTVNNQVKFPTEVTVLSGDQEISMTAQWEDVSYKNPGTYLVTGKIQYYSVEPVAVVDVYDNNRDVSAYDGNWAYDLVSKSAKNGLSNGVELAPQRVLDRADSAKLIFRQAVGEFTPIETTFSDVTPCNEYCAIFQTLADKNSFALSDGKFMPEEKTTRIEFLNALVTAEGDTLTENTGLPYQDVDGLNDQEKTALKIGLEKGIITSGDYFRPNDGITLGEALVVLGGVQNGAEINLTLNDNDTFVRNPDTGLFSYYLDNDPNNYDVAYGAELNYPEVAPEVSIMFMRFAWGFLEPKKGEYDFSIIDSAIQRMAAQGRQVAFRISCAETGFPYATPSWVYDEGCKSIRWGENGVDPNGNYLMPDHNDPIFLEYQEKFTKELAKRYDGNPNIAFVEIGNIGVWGEGHTYTSGVRYSLETAKRCIDMYADNFKETYVHVNNLTQGYAQLEDYCVERGIGWRNDSFYVNSPQLYTYKDQIEKYWRNLPVAMEPQHWERLQGWVPEDCIKAFTDLHPTFFGLHGYIGNIMMGSDGDFVRAAAKRVGYRFVPENITMTNQVNAHNYLDLNITWKNNGCARSYKDYYPAITLKNKNGAVETVMVDPGFTMSSIEPDSNLVEQARLRLNAIVPGGEYEAYLSVGKLDGTPVIAMPIDGDDGNRRYYLGTVTVRPDYEFTTEQISGTNKLNITMKVYDDVYGEYDVMATTLSFYTEDNLFGPVNGNFAYNLGDYNVTLEDALKNNKTVTMETPNIQLNGEMLEQLKGKTLQVKIRLYNDGLAKGDNVYRATGLDGTFTTLGTAVFDDNGNMTFTPRQ